MSRFYRTISTPDISSIEAATRSQSDNDQWKEERYRRITASVVGGICKLQKKTKICKKVQYMSYSKFRGNKATQYGKNMEPVSRNRCFVPEKE